MTLQRPLVFFDLETTGNDAQVDRIIQYCFIKLEPHGARSQIFSKVNPRIPISAGATAVHGITDEMVARCPDFKSCAPGVLAFISGCDFAGYNIIRFDVPVLQREMSLAGVPFEWRAHHLVDLYNIECRVNPRELGTIYRNYTGREMSNAHDAVADTQATVDIFYGQLGRHQLPADIAALSLYSSYDRPILDLAGKFSYDDQGYIIFNFSQHKGKRAFQEPGMLQWMLDRGFPADTREICQQLLDEGDPAAAECERVHYHNSGLIDQDLPF